MWYAILGIAWVAMYFTFGYAFILYVFLFGLAFLVFRLLGGMRLLHLITNSIEDKHSDYGDERNLMFFIFVLIVASMWICAAGGFL